MVDLEERLRALDEAKAKIIHESYLQEVREIEDDIRQQVEKLENAAATERNE